MIDGVKDTIYTHSIDDVCVIGASCKIHNHVIKEIIGTPEPFTFVNHYMGDTSMYIYTNQWGETLYIDEKLTKFEPKEEVKNETIPVIPFRASDTIQPCDEKWLIKKELIDLAALVDPDYICKPVQSCGCPPSSCGCGCNSTLKTCNSQ
jgi:hypothetical protein